MASAKTLRLAGALAAAALFPFALVPACSSDNGTNPTPPNPTYTVDAANPGDDSSTTNPGDDATTTNPGDDSSTVADAKEEPIVREDVQSCTLSQPAALGAPSGSKCWSCAPQIPSDYLNRCSGTGITCVPFDNSRLPGYDGGALPPTN